MFRYIYYLIDGYNNTLVCKLLTGAFQKCKLDRVLNIYIYYIIRFYIKASIREVHKRPHHLVWAVHPHKKKRSF